MAKRTTRARLPKGITGFMSEDEFDALFDEGMKKWEANRNLPTFEHLHTPIREKARAMERHNCMIRFGIDVYKTLEQLTDEELEERVARIEKALEMGICF